MAWATPSTFVTGEIVTAAKLNEIRDNLRYLKGLDGVVTVENEFQISLGGSYGPALRLINSNPSGVQTGYINFVNSALSTKAQLSAFAGGGFIAYGGGPGSMVVWGGTGIGASAVTVIPSGISRRWYAQGVVYLSSGVTANISIGAAAGATGNNIYIDGGTNQLVANTSSGALQIFRNAGALTYDVVMSVWYQ